MKKINYLYLGLFVSQVAIAQVGINKEIPRATMDIASKNGTVADGLLIPRMEANELKEMESKVTNEQNSLLVYVTKIFEGSYINVPTTETKYELVTSTGFYYYDSEDNGGKWKKLQDTPGGGGNVYLPGPGIKFTGVANNKVTSSGLERVTEQSSYYSNIADIGTQTNEGWRYVGMDESKYGSTGKWATDLQYIPKDSDEGSMKFYYVNIPGYPSLGLMPQIESFTYSQLKQEIGDKYGNGTSRESFDFEKVGAIGNHSLAGGVYNIVEGTTGAAFGYGNRNIGLATIVSGRFNDVSGKMSFVAGEKNTVITDNSLVVGRNNTLKSTGSSAIIGYENELSGVRSILMGAENKIDATKSIVLGTRNQQIPRTKFSIIIGDACKVGDLRGIAIGARNHAISTNAIAIGRDNKVEEGGQNGIAIGKENRVTNGDAVAIGANLTTSTAHQFVCGQHNIDDPLAAFILGWADLDQNLLVVKAGKGTMGDLHAYGNIFAGKAGAGKVVKASNFEQYSDIRLKKDIENLPVNSDVLSQLRPIQYHWKEGDNNTLQYGFIAQEIEKIFPNLVDTDTESEKYKSVNYVGLIPVLTKVLQEKSAEIASQKEEIASLKAQLQAEKERNDAQEARLKAIEAKLK